MSDFISGFFSWGKKTEKKEEPIVLKLKKEKTREDKEYLLFEKNIEEE